MPAQKSKYRPTGIPLKYRGDKKTMDELNAKKS